MENNSGVVRQHMKIYGRVQGVGFRYRAKYAADGLGITGWIKNEWDGTVELEAQGTVEMINRMLTIINGSSYIVIEDIERKPVAVEEYENGFHIR